MNTITIPCRFCTADYYGMRGRWSAIGWLLHKMMGASALDVLSRAKVVKLETMLASHLGVSKAELGELEAAVDAAHGSVATQRTVFTDWCKAHGIEIAARPPRTKRTAT